MNNMKKLLLIFLVLVSFASYGQRIQKANTYGLAFNRTGADTLFYLPSDTFTVPTAYLTYPFMARKGANVYIWNTSSNVWQGLTGGTLDTTGAFVTSVYRRSDSVFYVKGGVHTFAFKDSTGGGTPTLQQVLTAGSTLTGNNTITGGTYNLKFNKNNIWSVDSASQWLLRSFRAADSSMQLISSSASFASSIKRLTMQSQDSQYKSWNIIDYDHITNEVYTRPGAEFLQSGNYLDENGFSIIKYDGSELNNSLNIFELIGDSSRTAKRISYTSNINGTLTDYSLPTKKYVDSVAALGGGSYTFTNGLTDSSGTVKLGGTLTEATTTLDGGTTSTLRFQDMIFDVTGSIVIMMGDSIHLTGGTSTNRSDIVLKNDTIKIKPGLGLLFIDTLTSAVGTKALRYNPTTGLVSYADTTTGGSGGTPAGNYGNVQLNRNGAFATPASDSLDWETSTGLTSLGNLGVGVTTSTYKVSILDNQTTRDVIKLRNANSTGYASIGFFNYLDAQVGGFGYANPSIGAPAGNSIYFYSSSRNLIFSKDATASSSMTINGTTGQVGITTGLYVGSATGTATSLLHLKAGTASANTAPLKFTSGTNLTTAEAGAMEYNGTNLFFTPSSAARNNILMTAFVNSVSPTAPDRTITVVIDGTTYYIHAKTTND